MAGIVLNLKKKIKSPKLDHSSQNEPALGQAKNGTLHPQQRAGSRTCSRDANSGQKNNYFKKTDYGTDMQT